MDLTSNTAPQFPAWCPECGEANPAQYPVPIGVSILGCRSCASFWMRGDLHRMTVVQDPRLHQQESHP